MLDAREVRGTAGKGELFHFKTLLCIVVTEFGVSIRNRGNTDHRIVSDLISYLIRYIQRYIKTGFVVYALRFTIFLFHLRLRSVSHFTFYFTHFYFTFIYVILCLRYFTYFNLFYVFVYETERKT